MTPLSRLARQKIKARKAAEALADYENRFTKFEGELLVLKWMVGFVIALDLANLTRVFFS
jgi:hypothetical protein